MGTVIGQGDNRALSSELIELSRCCLDKGTEGQPRVVWLALFARGAADPGITYMKGPFATSYAGVEDFAPMHDAMNRANGPMSALALAAFRAAMYSVRRSTGITVHGYPPDANMAFMRNLPMRPFPSM